MRLKHLITGILLVCSFNIVQAQSARLTMQVTYTGHSEYGWSGGDCWESGTEEYTGKVWFWTDNDGTMRGGTCRTCDNNGNCGNGGLTDGYTYRFQSGSWLDAYVDAWEDDAGGRCDHNSGDDCRTQRYLSQWTGARNYRAYTRCQWNYLGGGQGQFGDDDNWAQIGFYWEYEGMPGTFTVNGSNQATICAGQSVSFSHTGYYGKPRYWMGSVGSVGSTSLLAGWNECADCYDNQASFSRQFNTPGIYLIRTHNRSECSDDWNWTNYVDVWVTVNANPVAPQALANVLVGTTIVLPDANITSSGACCGAGHEAFLGRVFDRRGLSNWSATTCCDVTNQFLQFDLGAIKPFNGIATQGRHANAAQWVGTVDVQYSMDGSTWNWVPGGPFPANTDNNTVAQHIFGQYHARYVRLWPRSVTSHITMRGEVISIPEEASTVTLSADVVANATTVRWYNAPTGGTLLGTGQVFVTPVLTQNTTYYAAAYNATTGCESTSRTAVTARINTMYGAGPAGLGSTDAKSDLKLWLNAGGIAQGLGSAISTWGDLSGSGYNATQGTGSQQPTLQTQSVMNGQRVARFATDDILATGTFLSQYEAYTILTASRLNGGLNQRLISSSVRNWLLGYHGGRENVSYAEGWVSGGCAGPGGTGATTNPYIYTGTGNGRWTRLFQNSGLTYQNNCGVQTPGGLTLGGTPFWSEYSNGDVGEVIAFNKDINNARRNIAENYLSAKYNIGTSVDLYLGDNTANGDCDFNMSGIGRDTEGWHQKSRSNGLYINDAGFLLNSGDYLLYGHNNSSNGWETSDLATCTSNPTRRLNRIWYFSKTDAGANGGNVTLSFNATELGLASFEAGTYRLMYRSGNSGNFASIAAGTNNSSAIDFTVNSSSLGNGQYTLSFEGTAPRAINFTASNTYLLHTTTGISPTSGTVMGWVNPSQSTDWGFWQTHDSNGENWLDWISMFAWTDGNFYFRVGDGSTCCNNDLTFNTATYIPNNQWSHLAFTWGSGLMTVYVNGVQIAQRAANFQGGMDPYARIGVGHGRMMKGYLDEMGIYNTNLNATQIQSLMFANVNNTNGLWNNLVAYYKMNETGSIAYDLSKNANNATRFNGTTASLYTASPSISGTNTLCIGSTTNYSVAFGNTLSRKSYTWSVTGGTINSGQGTSTINVTWNTSGSQNVSLNLNHHNECHTEAVSYPVQVDALPTLGTPSTAGPIVYCNAGGNYGTAVTVTGQTGSIVWDWGSSNGVWNNGWVAGSTAGNCCFPKKVSTNDGNADRMRYKVTNGTCPAVTSPTIFLQNHYNEAPTSLATSANNYCTGSVANITLTATFPSVTNILGFARFYSGTCNGTLVASTAGNGTTTVAATIAAPTVSTNYYVQYDPNTGAAGCALSGCVMVTVNVTPLTIGGTVSPASQTICTDQGYVPTQHTLGGHLGNIIQWEYKTPSSGWNLWPGTTTTAPGNCCFTSIGTWQVRALVQNGPCSQVYSSVADIIVVADPVAPAITPSLASGSTVCLGASLSATIGAGSGGTGTITDIVEYSNNGGTNWQTYTSGASISASTIGSNAVQIRTQRTATGTNCDNSGYTTVTWNVVADPTITITTPSQTICYGAGLTLPSSETGGTGSCSYQWQSRAVGSPTWANMGSASTQATGAITVPMEYQVIRSCNGLDCNSYTSSIVTLSISTTNTWTGAAGSAGVGNWDNPSNWSCGIVPTVFHNVIIPNASTAPNQPVIRNKATYGVATCKTININAGANLTNQAGGELQVIE